MRNPFNFKLKDEPTHEQQSLDLLTDPIDMSGEPTGIDRERPNGRFGDRELPTTDYGADRNRQGKFVSRDRDPEPIVRMDTGRFTLDKFGVGNFDAFGKNRR